MQQKKYTITLTIDKKVSNLKRVNDGFTHLELLGLLSLTTQEIIEQMKGNIKPDLVERKAVKKEK